MPSPWTEAREGIRDIAPAAVAAIPIGALFGALAVAKGLTPPEVLLMSGLVFAGGAQFAAMELWQTPAPVAVLAFSTLLINLRHVLMGASLAPKTGLFRPWQRAIGFYVMADENWAMAERRAARAPLTPAYYLGTAAFFYTGWLVWSGVGAYAGSFLGDPRRVGADFAFTALFIGLIAGFWKARAPARPRGGDESFSAHAVDVVAAFWKGSATGIAVLASAVAAALAYRLAGPPWHVPAGALAGIGAAALFSRRSEEAAQAAGPGDEPPPREPAREPEDAAR
jgi:4-azaleucine resistance transporter AzlC